MDIELVTPPSEEDALKLVKVSDLKANERISHSAHDATLLPTCIKRAYAFLDGRNGWLNRSILTQKWQLWLPSLGSPFELPLGPVQSVESIKYFDAAGDEQTLAADQYEVATGQFVCSIHRAPGAIWPAVARRKRAVSVTYVAGFGNAEGAGAIPFPVSEALKGAITLLASHFYRNPAATYAEPRTIVVNRVVSYGLEHLVGFLRVPPDHR